MYVKDVSPLSNARTSSPLNVAEFSSNSGGFLRGLVDEEVTHEQLQVESNVRTHGNQTLIFNKAQQIYDLTALLMQAALAVSVHHSLSFSCLLRFTNNKSSVNAYTNFDIE
jgi:hypothetical protein